MLTDEQLEKFEEYINLDGTEVGELCDYLLQLHNRLMGGYGIEAEALEKEVEKQIELQFKNFEDYAEIVEEEVTYTQKSKSLEWK